MSEQQKKWPLDSLIKYAQDETNPIEKRLAAFNRCLWNYSKDNPKLELKISQEYYNVATKHNQNERQCRALNFMGHAYMALGNFDSSYWSYENQYNLSIKLDEKNLINGALNNLGNLCNQQGNFKEALIYFRKSRDLSIKQGDSLNLARSYINIGEILEAQGQFRESLNCYKQAAEISDKNNYGGYQSSIHENLGDIYFTIGEYMRAQQAYANSLFYAKKSNNLNREIQATEKIAQLNFTLKDYDKSIINFNHAIELANEGSYANHIPRLKTGLAKVWIEKGDIKTAELIIKEAIQLYENLDDKMDSQKAYLVAGEIFYLRGKYSEAIELLKISFQMSSEINEVGTITKSSKLLYQAYKEIKNDKLSLYYLEEYNKWSSVQRNQNELKKVLEIELKKEFQNKSFRDSTNHIIEVRELKDVQDRIKNNRFTAYLIIVALLIVLTVLFYLFRLKRTNQNLLEKKNKVIEESLDKNETLLKEVRHRVKNNMQIVSSLLQLKEMNVDNVKAKESLKDTKQRIDTMITAHQRMYQSDNYDEIEIKGYIYELISQLLSSYQGENYDLIIEGEQVNIEFERAQALGFIIHELVTNSHKYAWPDKGYEAIEISIHSVNGIIQIVYQDNGIGMPKEFDIANATSFGLKLVNSMVTRQLRGNIRCIHSNGAKFIIDFKEK